MDKKTSPGETVQHFFKTFIANIDKSWNTSKPEYPMFIIATIAGFIFSLIFTAASVILSFKNTSSFATALLTCFAAPFLLIFWKWRNTQRNRELDYQDQKTNEELLIKAGEQLGSDKEAVRLCGLQTLDRYARLMMEKPAGADFQEFQRAVKILCAYARQMCRERIKNRTKLEETGEIPAKKKNDPSVGKLFKVFPVDYETCINLIAELMRIYKDMLESEYMGEWSKTYSPNILSFPIVDLNCCDLVMLNLNNTFLIRSNLQKANLQIASLIEANLQYTKLRGASLVSAYMQKANLREANLSSANLYIADLKEANLQGAYLAAANLHRADLQMANLRDTNIQNIKCHQTLFTSASFKNTKYNESDLKEAIIDGTSWLGFTRYQPSI